MRVQKKIKIFISVITILVISNYFSGFINIFTEGLFRTYHYQTQKAEFEFTSMPAKGRDIAMMERQFNNFKKENPKYKNLELFRTYKRNPLKFWNWYSFLTDDRYDYPYHKKTTSSESKFAL